MIKEMIVQGKTFSSKRPGFSDIELFQHICAHQDAKCLTCPRCKQKGRFTRCLSYSRMLITVEKGIRREYKVNVPFWVCECGHGHALLSDILIPYGSYCARFILYVLKEYLHRTCTVVHLCEKWQIAVSTLYTWIHRFSEHFSLWAGVMQAIQWVTDSSLQEVCSYIDFSDAFLNRFLSFSFLQGNPPTDSGRPGTRTDSS